MVDAYAHDCIPAFGIQSCSPAPNTQGQPDRVVNDDSGVDNARTDTIVSTVALSSQVPSRMQCIVYAHEEKRFMQ